MREILKTWSDDRLRAVLLQRLGIIAATAGRPPVTGWCEEAVHIAGELCDRLETAKPGGGDGCASSPIPPC